MSDPTELVNTESQELQNIHDIKDAPKKRGRPPKPVDPNAPPPAPKLKDANLYESMFTAISGCITATLPPPPFRIETIMAGEDDVRIPVHVAENGQCKRVKPQYLASLLMDYTRITLADNEFYRLEPRQLKAAVEYWELASKPIPTPPHVRFLDDPGLCWNRVPFRIEAGPTPLFDELFSRMTNAKAVKAWIGSLFIPESYREQYVWLYGDGDNGKSSLVKFIAKIFGKEGSLAQSCAPAGDHWAEPYPGKRFVYFPDFKDWRSLDTGPLKQLTGNDIVHVNPKYRQTYNTELECKLIFSSNHMPPIDPQVSSMRRIIFAEMSKKTSFDRYYAKTLWKEGGAFLASCKAVYDELCPFHEPIRTDQQSVDQLEAWASHADDMYDLWFRDFLQHKPGAFIYAHELAQRVLYRFKEGPQARACYAWLRKKGYSKVRASQGDRPWIYKNLITVDFQANTF